MGELALGKAEARLDVLLKVLGLLDSSDDSRIDRLLVRGLGLREGSLLLGLALREELLFSRSRSLGLGLGEVSVVELLVDLEIIF